MGAPTMAIRLPSGVCTSVAPVKEPVVRAALAPAEAVKARPCRATRHRAASASTGRVLDFSAMAAGRKCARPDGF